MKLFCKTAYFFVSGTRKYSSDVRVRFAPSPTGSLHLGGLRTALYNYLFAKANAGKFIVRIEDTDQARLVQGASEAIENDLLWVGIQPDESPSKGGPHGPYIQSLRLNHYREKTDDLIRNGTAYHCFCSDKRLDLLRRDAVRRGAVPRYDNRCRDLSSDEVADRIGSGSSFCVRFKLESGPESFEDLIYGTIVLDTAAIEGDPVIFKTDGFPTYHLACVVDDHLMRISHVLRGEEWQISTSKHLQLYRAFGWKPPRFCHLPLLMNSNGTKLSKRQGDIDISHFRKSGIFPEVLLSFITEFGGGFMREKGQPTVYRMDDLIKQFNISSVNTNSCRVEVERLTRLNRLELDRKLKDPGSVNSLCNQLRDVVLHHHGGELSLNSPQLSDKRLIELLHWGLPRMSRLENFVGPDLNYIWSKPSLALLKVIAKDSPELFGDAFKEVAASDFFTSSSFDKKTFFTQIKDICKSSGIDYRVFMKALRAALTGLQAGPPVAELIEIIGRNESSLRLHVAAESLQNCLDLLSSTK